MNIKKIVWDTFNRLHINHVFFCKHCNQCYLSRTLLKKDNKRVCPACESDVDVITHTPLGRAYFAFVRPDLGNDQTPSSV